MELWKEHPSLPNVWVSDQGRVRRRINATHPERGKPWKYFALNENTDRRGYTTVRVCVYKRNRVVARLVAETFLGLLPDQVVRHKNNNPLDNRLCNISVGTQKQNIYDKVLHETWQGGERHPCSKYDDQLVENIQRDLTIHRKTRGFAKKLSFWHGVPVHVIYDIAYGRRKTFKQRLEEARCECSDVT